MHYRIFNCILTLSYFILCPPPKIFEEQKITYDIYWNAYYYTTVYVAHYGQHRQESCREKISKNDTEMGGEARATGYCSSILIAGL